MSKTVIFEEKYKTEISKFSSTEQVTKFLEEKLNKRLDIIPVNQNIVSKRGNIFPITKNNIDEKIDKAIEIHSGRIPKLIKKLKSDGRF